MEETHGQQLFELPVEGEVLDFGVTEADIANADPRAELEDDTGEVRVDVKTIVGADQDTFGLGQAPDQNEVLVASTTDEDGGAA